MNPDHLRAAIERIGIEKPSDVTLVMEEVGRMEAEEKLRSTDDQSDEGWLRACASNEVSNKDAARLWLIADRYSTLLSAAEAVLAAGIVNPTGSMKVANAMDALVKAVREVKG